MRYRWPETRTHARTHEFIIATKAQVSTRDTYRHHEGVHGPRPERFLQRDRMESGQFVLNPQFYCAWYATTS